MTAPQSPACYCHGGSVHPQCPTHAKAWLGKVSRQGLRPTPDTPQSPERGEDRLSAEEREARDLTYAILRFYGYTDEDIAQAEQIHPGRVCSEEDCFDEDGESIHPPVYAEAGVTASIVVEVVLPWLAEDSRREREAAERAWSDGYNDAATMARCYGHTDYWEDEPDNPYAALASGRAASGADSEEGQR